MTRPPIQRRRKAIYKILRSKKPFFENEKSKRRENPKLKKIGPRIILQSRYNLHNRLRDRRSSFTNSLKHTNINIQYINNSNLELPLLFNNISTF